MIKSELGESTTGWSNKEAKDFHNLDEKAKIETLEKNKHLISDYIENELDKDHDGNLKLEDINDTNKKEVIDFTKEIFVDDILEQLGLDKVNLHSGIDVSKIIEKINEFTVEKGKALAESRKQQAELKQDVKTKPIGVVEVKESSDGNKGTFGLLRGLLDSDHNGTFKQLLGFKDKVNSSEIPSSAILKQLQSIPENKIQEKLLTIMGKSFKFKDGNELKFEGDGNQLFEQFSKMDPDQKDELSQEFIHKLSLLVTSGTDLISYFNGIPSKNGFIQEGQNVNEGVIESIAENIRNIEGIKEGLRQQIREKAGEEKQALEETLKALENMPASEQSKLNLQLRGITANTLLVGEKFQAGGLSFDIRTGLSWPANISISIGLDKSGTFNGGINTNLTLFSGQSADRKTAWGSTVSLSTGGVNLSAGLSRNIKESTSNFASILKDDGSFDLSNLEANYSIGGGVSGGIGWKTLGVPSGAVGVGVNRDFISSLQLVSYSFENELSKIDWVNKGIKVSDIQAKINTIQNPKIKNFIKKATEEVTKMLPPDSIINLRDVVIQDFAKKLADSTKNDKKWDITNVGLGVITVGGLTIPTIMGGISVYKNIYNVENQKIFRNDREVTSVEDANKILKILETIQLSAHMNNEGHVQIFGDVSKNMEIKIPKDATISDLIGYDKNGKLTVVSKGMVLKQDNLRVEDTEKNVIHTRLILGNQEGLTDEDFRTITQDELNSLSNEKPSLSGKSYETTDVGYDTNEFNEHHSSEIDELISKNINNFAYLRTENRKLTVSFYDNFLNENYENAKSELIKILSIRPKLKPIANLIQQLEGPQLNIAMAQVKNVMMIDHETIEAIRKQDENEKGTGDFREVLKNRSEIGKDGKTTFERVFENSFSGIDTAKYNNYFNDIIAQIGQNASSIPKAERESKMFGIIATYPASSKGVLLTSGIDLIPPGISTALGGVKVELATDDNKNKELIAGKIANSSYGKTIINLINDALKDKSITIDELNLKELITGEATKVGGTEISINSKFYAFLNGVSANESLGMEVEMIQVNHEVINFNVVEGYGVTKTTTGSDNHGVTFTHVPEQKEEREVNKQESSKTKKPVKKQSGEKEDKETKGSGTLERKNNDTKVTIEKKEKTETITVNIKRNGSPGGSGSHSSDGGTDNGGGSAVDGDTDLGAGSSSGDQLSLPSRDGKPNNNITYSTTINGNEITASSLGEFNSKLEANGFKPLTQEQISGTSIDISKTTPYYTINGTVGSPEQVQALTGQSPESITSKKVITKPGEDTFNGRLNIQDTSRITNITSRQVGDNIPVINSNEFMRRGNTISIPINNLTESQLNAKLQGVLTPEQLNSFVKNGKIEFSTSTPGNYVYGDVQTSYITTNQIINIIGKETFYQAPDTEQIRMIISTVESLRTQLINTQDKGPETFNMKKALEKTILERAKEVLSPKAKNVIDSPN